MTQYLLDTHIWLWAQRKDTDRLSAEALAEIERWQQAGVAYVSPFSAWELGLLVANQQIDLGISVEEYVERGTEDGGLRMAPLTARILIESTRLPGELHRDPADRILVATARVQGMTLVTSDKLLLRYGREGHVRVHKL